MLRWYLSACAVVLVTLCCFWLAFVALLVWYFCVVSFDFVLVLMLVAFACGLLRVSVLWIVAFGTCSLVVNFDLVVLIWLCLLVRVEFADLVFAFFWGWFVVGLFCELGIVFRLYKRCCCGISGLWGSFAGWIGDLRGFGFWFWFVCSGLNLSILVLWFAVCGFGDLVVLEVLVCITALLCGFWFADLPFRVVYVFGEFGVFDLI